MELNGSRKVLILDDEEMIAKLVAKWVFWYISKYTKINLDLQTFTVNANCLEQVCVAVKSLKPGDLLITDWNMKVVEAPQLLELIPKDSDGKCAFITIMSGKMNMHDVPERLRAGVILFLSKPFGQKDFCRVLIASEFLPAFESGENGGY